MKPNAAEAPRRFLKSQDKPRAPFRRPVVISWGLALAAILPAPQASSQPFFTASAAPVFTAEQVTRGKAVYDLHCASCHGVNLDDGPFGGPLRGPLFKSHWSGQSAVELFTYISTKMPPSGRGTLTDKNYADAEAYILNANGIVPGEKEFAPAPGQPGDMMSRPANRDAVYNEAVARRQALLNRLTPVDDAMLRQPPEEDWLLWRRTYENLSFSPLKHITSKNAGDLRMAWSLPLPISINEITPLVHDSVLFVQSGASVQALNAATGEPLWEYVYPLPDGKFNVRDARMKNIGLYENRLYAPTPDGHLIALEAKTGKLLWKSELVSAAQSERGGMMGTAGFRLNSGPLVAKGKVIIGVSGGNSVGGGSYIVAVDAASGKESWRFNTVARPGQPGGDSWNGAPFEQRYGGGVWTTGSFDAERNLVYFGTGNTYSVGTLFPKKTESNDALYTDSTLALNPETGKLVWFYQHMNRDVWDMDWSFERSLITLPVNGQETDLLVTGGKIAIFDALERGTGTYLFSKNLGLSNLVTAIDPVTGKKTTNPALEPEAGIAKTLCPNANGARNWLTTAFDPATNILYVPLFESCTDYVWNQRSAAEIAAGGNDMRFIQKPMEGTDGKFGRIEAINIATGKIVWSHRQRAGMASSLVATAGGVVFSGAFDRLFRAYDSATGAVVWETALSAPPNASPITYAVDGRQYVAVTTGAGGPIDTGTTPMTPELHNPPGGITLWVFALPRQQ